MPVFAPGVWAGVNDSFAIARDKERQDILNAERRQQMERSQWELQQARRNQGYADEGARGTAAFLRNRLPPPVGGPPPQGPGPQPPMPGTPSQPMQPPGGGGQPMLAPGVPQFSAPPMAMGGPAAPQLGAPMQLAPYRTVPQVGAGQGAPGGTAPVGPMAPPQVSQAEKQRNLVLDFLDSDQAKGMSPQAFMQALDKLKPIVQMQRDDEALVLRFMQAENAALKAQVGSAETKRWHDALIDDKARGRDQADKRLDLSAQRMQQISKRLEQAKAAGEELTPEGMKVALELTRAGQPIPGGWGKNGVSRGNAILNALAKEEEGGAGSGAVATGRADAKAAGGALNQVSKDLAAIRPFKVMLDKNIDIAIELGKKAQLSNSQLGNRTIQWLKKNASSDPNLREYLGQIQIVQTEAARVLNNPRLVGQLTDSARHEMQDIVNGAMPLADTERVLRRMQRDGTNRVQAMEVEERGLKSRVSGSGKKPDAAGGDQDAQAIAWAKANPNDPRAKQIMKLHPGQ